MNMNLDIVNRALFDAGQSPLGDGDIAGKNTAYLACKAYYLAAFLEALSEVEWVGGRKRARLALTGRPLALDRRYRFAYDAPFDCAKPIELQGNEFFLAEDRLILADVPRAELLYVSNGKVLRPIAAAVNGGPGELPETEYLSAGQPGLEPDVTLWAGEPDDILDELPPDPEPADDYPDYIALGYEPKFYEYVEKSLAAKLSMKLSSQPELHSLLMQEAMLIKREAVDATRSARAAKIKGNRWWTEDMGN
jgi:hypothetical protein